jgi:SlyX protein
VTETPLRKNRLDTLESTVAHQDQTIEELSDVVARQAAEISDLTEKLNSLRERLSELEESDGDGGPDEPPPPHY